ncbi:MAG TPA: fumarylacetoacetase, partial [Acidobacteriaceae bacterium]|nr:fumarylacetoacetase [Acidobacteriaceae bacterium]
MRQPCWLESANDPQTDFPIENLPFGNFEAGKRQGIGLAIGDQIIDLRGCRDAGLFGDLTSPVFFLNRMGGEPYRAREIRQRLTVLLTDSQYRSQVEPHLIPQSSVQMVPPFRIGDYTDFYASIHHATNVGRLFRPDNPLLPNYKYVPIGYHGRASSIVISGTEVRRPCGQTKAPDAPEPKFGPSRMLDDELEMGIFVGDVNILGDPVPIDDAKYHIFGLCLVNDWSARDIQSWEYQPLGPFLGKSFATTISPWVVTLDALEPYRVPVAARPEGDPTPLPYLWSDEDQQRGAFDIHLEVSLLTAQMRASGQQPFRISRGNLRDLYWTPAQMLAHHTSNGCNLRPGDLLATGTISGPTPDSVGSLLERTKRGSE